VGRAPSPGPNALGAAGRTPVSATDNTLRTPLTPWRVYP
jgi:hypothetical protein